MFNSKTSLVALLIGCTRHDASAQPILGEDYGTQIFTDRGTSSHFLGDACFSDALESIPGSTPTTAQYLAMFSDKFVEVNGKVFAVKNAQGTGGIPNPNNSWGWGFENGLYEVRDEDPGTSCVRLVLLYSDDNIGQIVGSGPRFDPIQVISVDQATYRIHGYYQDDNGEWTRKRTVWGYALDGSLVAEPVEDGETTPIAGISRYDNHPEKDGSLFSLYGDFDNFNYSRKDNVKCAGRPAIIDDWTGHHAQARGTYCPGEGNNRLKKRTWRGSGGTTVEELSWEPAAKIARLGPKSTIYGISTHYNLLKLWYDNGVIKSAPLLQQNSPVQHVNAVGGLDDGYARGVFVSNHDHRVYNVHWRSGEWKAQLIDIDYADSGSPISVYFGNNGEHTYLIYGTRWHCSYNSNIPHCDFGPDDPFDYRFTLYRLNYVGGEARYEAELLSVGV